MDKYNYPLVSILIPVYNREKIVAQTIESALSQTYCNFEIIITDNCSTDNTWEVLNKYASENKNIKIYRNEENVGPVLNWKKCLELAQGEYVKFLFSDDTISNNFIAETIPLFDEDTAFVLSRIDIFGKYAIEGFGDYHYKTVYSKNAFIYHAILDHGLQFSVSPGCGLFRESDLKSSLVIDIPNVWGLDFKRYGAGNDLLIFLLTSLKYKYVRIAPQAVAYFRAHEGSFTVSSSLWLYYDWAKLNFLINHFPQLIPKFKTLMWIRIKERNAANPALESIQEPMSQFFRIAYGFESLKRRIKKKFKALSLF